MRFDWYAATCRGGPDVIVGALLASWDLSSVRPARALMSYANGAEVFRGEQVLARVMWGGESCGPGVHVIGEGEQGQAVADVLRGEQLGHRVTRADVCQDFRGSGSWHRGYDLVVQVADKYRLKTQLHGDYIGGLDGRSVYAGAPSSPVRCRCYEKGVQIGGDRDHVRMEVQVRPKGAARDVASTMAPVQFWGFSRWSSELIERLSGLQVELMPAGTLYRPSDDERAIKWLVRQYGPLLGRVAVREGGAEGLGRFLVAAIEKGGKDAD